MSVLFLHYTFFSYILLLYFLFLFYSFMPKVSNLRLSIFPSCNVSKISYSFFHSFIIFTDFCVLIVSPFLSWLEFGVRENETLDHPAKNSFILKKSCQNLIVFLKHTQNINQNQSKATNRWLPFYELSAQPHYASLCTCKIDKNRFLNECETHTTII